MEFISARQLVVEKIYKLSPQIIYTDRTSSVFGRTIKFSFLITQTLRSFRFFYLVTRYVLQLNKVIQDIFFQWISVRQTISQFADYVEIRNRFIFPLFCVSTSLAQPVPIPLLLFRSLPSTLAMNLCTTYREQA